MATNREMLKEAIAEAKAVKEMAIANAKAALEETFTPQLKSMLSLKLQEMEMEDEELDEAGFGKRIAEPETGFSSMGEKALDEEEMEEGEGENMYEVDLEELLKELELEEEEEPLYEAEEGEEEGEEEESEDTEMEDLSDDEIKSMIEDVIAQMIADKELEAGPEFGAEEGEEMEMSDEDEEEVDLAELLKEIEEMEDEDLNEETLNEWYWEAGDPSITIAFLAGGIGGLLTLAGAYYGGVKKFKREEIAKNLAFAATIKDPAKQKDFAKMITDAIGDDKSLQKRFKDELDKIQSGLKNVSEGEKSEDPTVDAVADALAKAGIDPSAAATASEKAEAAIEKATQGETSSQNEEMEEMADELAEALSTIKTLKSELNEINLLNAKLLYSNKIFKAKNLNESQKVKVLSSFDKAKNVSEVKIVFETLNEGIKTAKSTIKENLGRASKITNTPTTRQPIVESNDVFKRMQKLAGLI
jgi:hypothetical protein